MSIKLTTYERFSRMYRHRDADRVPVLDSPWEDTIDRWVREGMPTRDYVEHFDLDKAAYIHLDNSPRYERKVIEETDRYVVYTTPWGVTQRSWKHATSTPEHLSYKVTTPEAWAEAKRRMTDSNDRIPWDYLQKNYKRWRKEGYWTIGVFHFGFDVTHTAFIGTENMLVAMYEDPEWCRDIFRHQLEMDISMMNRMWDAGYRFDELFWCDDMGYKGTQFFSLDMYRDILKPFHKQAIEWGHRHDVVVRLHSCGNINAFVPDLVEMGLDGLNPLEVKAGMDPLALKKQFGNQLVLHGGVNAVHWAQPNVIIGEIETLLPQLKQNGGYIFASDHSIPNDVSLSDFARIIETVKRCGSYE